MAVVAEDFWRVGMFADCRCSLLPERFRFSGRETVYVAAVEGQEIGDVEH